MGSAIGSLEASWLAMEYHIKLPGIEWEVPWASMESVMGCYSVPWCTMETHGKFHGDIMGYTMRCHEPPWDSMAIVMT